MEIPLVHQILHIPQHLALIINSVLDGPHVF